MDGAAPRTDGTSGARKARRAVLVAVVLVIGLVGGLVAMTILSQSTGPVDAELARLRAAGFPATPEEVFGVAPRAAADGAGTEPGVDVEAEAAPVSDNGADDVAAAFAWLEETIGPWGAWGVTGPWDPNAVEDWRGEATPEQLEALRSFLDRARPFFDRVDEGLAKPRFTFVPQLDAAGVASYDSIRQGQRLTLLLSSRAAAAAASAERIAAMSTAARLCHRTESCTLIEVMVALAMQSVAIREARAAAQDGSIPAAELRLALDGELERPLLPKFVAAARGEPALLAALWRAERTGQSTVRPPQPPFKRLVRSIERMFEPSGFSGPEDLTAGDMADAMRLWADVAAIDASSPAAFRAGIDSLTRRTTSDLGGTIPLLESIASRAVRQESISRLARVALAAKAHREATGAWPESLDELAPSLGGAVPTDARSGKPFVCSTDGPKVRLAAPGDGDDANLRDDLLLWEFAK